MLATYSFLTPRLACSARVARLALPSHLRPACAPVLQRWLPYEARSPLSTSRSVRAENTSQAVVDTIPQGDTIQIHRIPQGTTEDDIRALFAPSSGHILQVRRTSPYSRFGFVQFADAAQAAAVVDRAKSSPFILQDSTVKVTHASGRPARQPARWVAVYGFPKGSKAEAIAAVVGVEPEDVRLYGPTSAQVDFGTIARATQIVDASSAEPKTLDGATLDIGYMKDSPAPPGKTLYYVLGETSLEKVKYFLSEYKDMIEKVKPAPKSRRGSGWITFKDTQSASRAMREMNGKYRGDDAMYLSYVREVAAR